MPIVGVGKGLQIDKSKLGKRKYHGGRDKDAHWVFRSVERDGAAYLQLLLSLY